MDEIPAGATVLENGDLLIPGTRRPDGTWRKERRVRAGYVPQEEQKVFETKASRFNANKPKLPPGMAPEEAENSTTKKGTGKSRRRKKKAASGVSEIELMEDEIESENFEMDKGIICEKQEVPEDPMKRLKNLQKKVRSIEELKEKVKAGLCATPEQMEKISRLQLIQEEISKLECAVEMPERTIFSGDQIEEVLKSMDDTKVSCEQSTSEFNEDFPVANTSCKAKLSESLKICEDVKAQKEESNENGDEEAQEKKVKALKKKLREIEQLVTKQQTGAVLAEEQLEKIRRKNSLLEDLRKLVGVEIKGTFP